MAIVESASATPIESVAADPALVEAPATDDVPPAVKTAKAKAIKAPKEKKTVTKKLLLIQLQKLTTAGKLTKVKNSYKIPAKPVVGGKKTAVSAKLKPKSAAVKPKTAAKSKSVAPKPKASSGLAKAAKNSVKATPAKLKMAAPIDAKKPKTVKKIPAVNKAEK